MEPATFSIPCDHGSHHSSIATPPNVPLLRALWSLLVGTWGILKGSWRVLVFGSIWSPQYGIPLQSHYQEWETVRSAILKHATGDPNREKRLPRVGFKAFDRLSELPIESTRVCFKIPSRELEEQSRKMVGISGLRWAYYNHIPILHSSSSLVVIRNQFP